MSVSEVFVERLAGQVLAPPGSDLVLAEWLADGADGADPVLQAPMHRHDESEAWYVLDGSLGVRIGDREVTAPAGGAVVVPGGTLHTFWNPGADPARYLLVMGARTHALIQALHDGTTRDEAGVRGLFARHGARLLE